MSCNCNNRCNSCPKTNSCGCTKSYCQQNKKKPCSNNGSSVKWCHEVVDTYAEVQEFRDALVTVVDENAVYHVDGSGNPVSVSRNPIFQENYSPEIGDYKQNTVYDFINNRAYVFNAVGVYRTIILS